MYNINRKFPMRVLALCLVALAALFPACGGEVEYDHEAAAGGASAAPVPTSGNAGAGGAPEFQELMCHYPDGTSSPCPDKVYDNFGLPRPPGHEAPSNTRRSNGENVGSSAQALGVDKFCSAAQASTGPSPCCTGADNCYVNTGAAGGVVVYNCNGALGAHLCSNGTNGVWTFNVVDGFIGQGLRSASCVCATINANDQVRSKSELKACSLSSGFAAYNAAQGRTVCGRPNQGWTAFQQTRSGAWSGAYTCRVTASILPSSSCN